MAEARQSGEQTSDVHAIAEVSLLRRLVNPIRVALFLLAFEVFAIGCAVYRSLAITIPSRLSTSYRRRHYRRLWNHLIRFWGRTICRLAEWFTGLRVEVEGDIPPGRHIVVTNHQSAADIFILFDVFNDKFLKFVAKKELARFVPNVSSAVRGGGLGIVDFTNRRSTLESLRSFARGLAAWDGSPLIFPEGQRTEDGSVGPFRRVGIQLLVRETGLPVLPVLLDGMWRARTLGRFFVYLPGSRCRVCVLRPIPGEEATAQVETLPERLEEVLREELGRRRRAGASSEKP